MKIEILKDCTAKCFDHNYSYYHTIGLLRGTVELPDDCIKILTPTPDTLKCYRCGKDYTTTPICIHCGIIPLVDHSTPTTEPAEVDQESKIEKIKLEEIAKGLMDIDWCIGYELTEKQMVELDRLRDLAFTYEKEKMKLKE